jgi:hypothetical protein
LLKRFRIGLGALALIVMAALVHGSGAAASVLADVEMASSQIGDTLSNIDAKFDLSEPIFRGTDRGDAMLILALVFSGIIAFNCWLVRHLHCVYAPLRSARR